MTDLPIIFSGAMVRALLDDRKSQTRRLSSSPMAKVKPGDRLWVRETWKPHSIYADMKPRNMPVSKVFYNADDSYAPSNTPWIPCIHMPRWVSRLTLVVTEVRRQQLQDISAADCIAEGIRPAASSATIDCETEDPRHGFRELWESLHGAGSWAANPELVCLSLEVHRCNIDQMKDAA